MISKSESRARHTATLTNIQLDRNDSRPLHQQLYDSLRRAILSRQFEPGIRLPSTRMMASTLGISRNTVLNAVEQLYAEGYLDSKVGAGTFVTSQLPDGLLQAMFAEPLKHASDQEPRPRTLSQRGQRLNRARRSPPISEIPPLRILFDPGIAAVNEFPFDLWAKLHRRFCKGASANLMEYYLDPAGYYPLRQSIATFLKATRAIDCAPEQIIITSGSQEALYLSAQVLLDRGDKALVEQPGYIGSHMAIGSSGGQIVPIPIDDEGMAIHLAQSMAPDARAAYITPSHQFPLGITMTLKRRLEMLTWAEQNDGWIVEDDYDSLYRYEGQPLAALQGLDNSQRVLYVGTFSKVLYSGLRLGFIVVPEDIVEAFLAMRACIDLSPPIGSQYVLNEFIVEGHFSRHMRRMLQLYSERRDCFVTAIDKYLGDKMTLGPSDSGMHATGLFTINIDDEAVWRTALSMGIHVSPLSRLFWGGVPTSGITFGFVNLTPAQIDTGIQTLAKAIAEVEKSSRP